MKRGLLGIFPIHEDHHAQLVLEGDMPDQGRVEMDMGPLLQRAEVLKAVQVVKVDLAVILALAPRGAWGVARYRGSDSWRRGAAW